MATRLPYVEFIRRMGREGRTARGKEVEKNDKEGRKRMAGKESGPFTYPPVLPSSSVYFLSRLLPFRWGRQRLVLGISNWAGSICGRKRKI